MMIFHLLRQSFQHQLTMSPPLTSPLWSKGRHSPSTSMKQSIIIIKSFSATTRVSLQSSSIHTSTKSSSRSSNKNYILFRCGQDFPMWSMWSTPFPIISTRSSTGWQTTSSRDTLATSSTILFNDISSITANFWQRFNMEVTLKLAVLLIFGNHFKYWLMWTHGDKNQ